jgi:predicted ATPase
MALVGRDEIVSEIVGQLLRRRLVTTTGAGGVGIETQAAFCSRSAISSSAADIRDTTV